MKLRKKRVKPIGLKDITIVDDNKMRKAITAADAINGGLLKPREDARR